MIKVKIFLSIRIGHQSTRIATDKRRNVSHSFIYKVCVIVRIQVAIVTRIFRVAQKVVCRHHIYSILHHRLTTFRTIPEIIPCNSPRRTARIPSIVHRSGIVRASVARRSIPIAPVWPQAISLCQSQINMRIIINCFPIMCG